MTMQQRSPEWYAARVGKLTASRMNDAVDVLKKGGESQARINYRLELATERLTGMLIEKYTNTAMQWGIDNEPKAREEFELLTGEFVTEVGFYDHPAINGTGASPDGLVGIDGLIEIKCPTSQTHLQWVLDNKIPEKHINQMLWQMACTGRKYCHFVSFDPRMPPELQLFHKVFEPKESEIPDLEQRAIDFLSTVDELIANIYSNIKG